MSGRRPLPLGAVLAAALRVALPAALLGGCAGPASTPPTPSPAELQAATERMLRASFREQGIARLDRLEQDEMQRACSGPTPPPPDVAERIQREAQASIRWPEDGKFLGDWREGEKLAQNGRGMTWTDAPGAPSGGNCYNCHRLAPAEISYGTLGPSLYQYGKLRDASNPEVVRYTWGKLWNAKATNACSNMPRMGAHGVLSMEQMKHLMALLLDPASPVNQ